MQCCAHLCAICLSVFVLSADTAGWEKGVLYAEGQNLARLLMEAPANHITPTTFANTIEEKLMQQSERVTVMKRFVLWLFLTESFYKHLNVICKVE